MYDPPSAHYSELDVSHLDPQTVFTFMGRNGRRFYWLTRRLSLDYLWFDHDRKKIEIWGAYETHEQSRHIIEAELEHFLTNLENSG